MAFDEFGSFKITGSYQATILEYRFGCEDGSKREYSSFEDYLSAATHKCTHQSRQFVPSSFWTSLATTEAALSSN